MLLPFLGQSATRSDAVKVLDILVDKGNAKEVFLKCTDALKLVVWDSGFGDGEDGDDGEATLTGNLKQISCENEEVDPVMQTVELSRAATRCGIPLLCS
jgi:hypothetical protein